MTGKKMLAVRRPDVRKLLRAVGGRIVRPSQIAERAAGLGLSAAWAEREMNEYVVDADTAVFELPLARLSGAAGLDFAQQVWMLGPALFEYVTLGDVALVRLRWNGRSQVD